MNIQPPAFRAFLKRLLYAYLQQHGTSCSHHDSTRLDRRTHARILVFWGVLALIIWRKTRHRVLSGSWFVSGSLAEPLPPTAMWFLRASLARPRTVTNRLKYCQNTSRRKSGDDIYNFKSNERTAEEDHKLLKLHEQAVKEKRPWSRSIAEELGNRSVNAVLDRFRTLRSGARTSGRLGRTPRWSADELSILREKLQQGIVHVELAKYLPGRSLAGIKYRIRQQRCVDADAPSNCNKVPDFTDAEVQRAIAMRLKEAKSLGEVATELRCTLWTARVSWRDRCAALLNQKENDIIYSHTRWSHAEFRHLEELCASTTLRRSEVALHFPSKTQNAVHCKIMKSQLTLASEHDQAQPGNQARPRTPVVHRKSSQAMGSFEQRRMCSMSSYALIKNTKWRHWTAEEDRKLLELDQQGLKKKGDR